MQDFGRELSKCIEEGREAPDHWVVFDTSHKQVYVAFLQRERRARLMWREEQLIAFASTFFKIVQSFDIADEEWIFMFELCAQYPSVAKLGAIVDKAVRAQRKFVLSNLYERRQGLYTPVFVRSNASAATVFDAIKTMEVTYQDRTHAFQIHPDLTLDGLVDFLGLVFQIPPGERITVKYDNTTIMKTSEEMYNALLGHCKLQDRVPFRLLVCTHAKRTRTESSETDPSETKSSEADPSAKRRRV
jgi:hypothetical protein